MHPQPRQHKQGDTRQKLAAMNIGDENGPGKNDVPVVVQMPCHSIDPDADLPPAWWARRLLNDCSL